MRTIFAGAHRYTEVRWMSGNKPSLQQAQPEKTPLHDAAQQRTCELPFHLGHNADLRKRLNGVYSGADISNTTSDSLS